MRRSKQAISFLLTAFMILTVFAGCGADSSSSGSNSDEEHDNIFASVSGPTLPDPDTYFNNQLIRNEDLYDANWDRHCRSYCTDPEGVQAFHDYVSLLSDEKYQLDCTFKKEETLLYLNSYIHGFTYTGSEDIPDAYVEAYDVQADLIVIIQTNGSAGNAIMSFYYRPDTFEFKNFGDRTSYTLKDMSNNKNTGSGSGSGDNDYGSALSCRDCGGSGNCKNCDGDGLVWSSASDTENRICPKCHTNRGKCPTCKGSGNRMN